MTEEVSGTESRLREYFLVLEANGDSGKRVSLAASLSEVITRWTAATRTSPVYRWIQGDFGVRSPEEYFSGECELLFLQFVRPETLRDLIPGGVEVWLTFGAHNAVLIADPSKRLIREVRAWAENTGIAGEVWLVRNQELVNTAPFNNAAVDMGWRAPLARTIAQPWPEMIRETLSEYGPLFASSMARAQRALPELADPLWRTYLYVHQSVGTLMESADVDVDDVIQGMHLLITSSAALSRFASQAFSGTSPIVQTECHFWSHSLLGTGVANRGLWRFVDALNHRLHQEQCYARFASYAALPFAAPALEARVPDDIVWKAKYFADAVVKDQDEFLPLIAFFSGRDGFNATGTTMSAPLAAVSACNTEHWTLRTCTHELSHGVIRQALSLLRLPLTPPQRGDPLHPLWSAAWALPNDTVPDTPQSAIDRLLSDTPPPTLLAALQRYFLLTILDLQRTEERTAEGQPRHERIDYETVTRAMHVWSREVEELMAHAFDFLWFYGSQDPDLYVRGIWQSWSVIPSIRSRVPEYVVRTLNTLQVVPLKKQQDMRHVGYPADKHFAEHPIMLEARDAAKVALEGLKGKRECGPFVEEALQYINRHWTHIADQLRARQGLVRIVLSFLYDDARATKLRVSEFAGTGSHVYKTKYPGLEAQMIDNPLHFITTVTELHKPDAAKALWMWHMLAFYTPSPRVN